MTITKQYLEEQSAKAQEYAMGRKCPTCKLYPFYVEAGIAMAPGHVYSRAGLSEISITGMCEWCFDAMENPDDRAERTGSVIDPGHTARDLPLDGTVLQTVTNLDDYDADSGRYDTDDVELAQVITSMVEPAPSSHEGRVHKVVLDIDLPAKLIPSSTEGHFHLYIDKEVPHDRYVLLLKAMQAAGILEEGYVSASVERGFTAARLPWIRKPDPEVDRLIQEAMDEHAAQTPVADGGTDPWPF